MKKILALTLVLIVLLPGCSTIPAETTGNDNTASTVPSGEETTSVLTVTEPDSNTLPLYIDPDENISFVPYRAVPEQYNVSVQRIPETVDNPNDLPVLKWVCFLQPQDRVASWSDTVMTEINQMLAEKNMPFRLQLVIASIEIMAEDILAMYLDVDWPSIPEAAGLIAEADLVYCAFSGETGQQYLLPITEYVTGNAQPSLKNAVPHEKNWETVTRDAQIYGIPAYASTPHSNGWSIKPGMLDKWGLTAEDFQKNFWEMDETFAKIYEANGRKPFLFLNDSSVRAYLHPGVMPNDIPLQHQLSSRYQFDVGAGFCLELKGEQPTVNTILESEEVRLVQQAYIRYQDAGYTVGKYPALRFGAVEGTSPFTDRDGTLNIPVTESYFDQDYNGFLYVNGVAMNTPYAAEAIRLLSLVAEDEVFREHLCFGLEGRDYRKENGRIVRVRNEDGSSYQATFLSPLSKFSPICEEEEYRLEGKTTLESYREAMENCTYQPCPIRFDFTGFESELAQLGKLLGTYNRRISNTSEQRIANGAGIGQDAVIPRMDENGYERVLQAQKDVGSDKIKAALQAQLDAWLAENPDWSAKVN